MRTLKIAWIAVMMVLATACGGASNTRALPTPADPASIISSPAPSREILGDELITTEDDNLRVSISGDTYSRFDNIRFKITAVGKKLYYPGPCDLWFERKVGRVWKKVGVCPDTNFTDEPLLLEPQEEVELALPMSRESEYHYSYHLTPGIHRFVIAYLAQGDTHIIYSPEFKIIE